MLTRRTLFGAAWTVSSRLAGRLIDFATLLVLSRTLTPSAAASEAAGLWQVAAACAAMTVLVLGLKHGLAGMHLASALKIVVISGFGAAVYLGSLLGLGIRLKSYVEAVRAG